MVTAGNCPAMVGGGGCLSCSGTTVKAIYIYNEVLTLT